MNEELTKVEQIENEISIIEQSHKTAILSVHENIQQLVNDSLSIVVIEDDKKSYDKAVELKRIVKATHVAIEKKRKEVKQPLIDYGKRLDKWVEEIYTPLVNAEKVIKKKMEAYEARQEKLKQERKVEEEKKQAEEQAVEEKLRELNLYLGKINLAKSKAELIEINTLLDNIDLSEFGKKSDEAGFILTQLKMTCSMAFRLIVEEEQKPIEEEKPIQEEKVEFVSLKNSVNEEFKENIVETIFESVQENKPTESVQESISDDNFNFPVDLDKFTENDSPKLETEANLSSENISFNEEQFNKIRVKSKATDEDVIKIIHTISSDVLNEVINLIETKIEDIINNLSSLDFSEHNELIITAARKRVGILLNK
jgi:hypothetical protein